MQVFKITLFVDLGGKIIVLRRIRFARYSFWTTHAFYQLPSKLKGNVLLSPTQQKDALLLKIECYSDFVINVNYFWNSTHFALCTGFMVNPLWVNLIWHTLTNEEIKMSKQAMIKLQGMAEHRLNIAFHYQWFRLLFHFIYFISRCLFGPLQV